MSFFLQLFKKKIEFKTYQVAASNPTSNMLNISLITVFRRACHFDYVGCYILLENQTFSLKKYFYFDCTTSTTTVSSMDLLKNMHSK